MQRGSRTSVPVGNVDRTKKAILASQMAAILLVPLALLAFSSNPPAGESGATAGNGGSTCGTNSCHFHGTSASAGGVTANTPSTYTPGGGAIPITVTLTHNGGFEMSAVQGSGTTETQAGSFAAGTGSAVSTSGGIQYIVQTSKSTSFSFMWTPPATNVGTITMNLAGVSGETVFANTSTLTPASGVNMLTVNPTLLTFTSSGGSTPPSQAFQVMSSGASVAFTTSVSTALGGSWLSATPAGGTTPLGVTVSANPAGLASGTYTGTIAVAAASVSNSPLSVGVTLTVTGGPPPTPMITLTPGSMTFHSPSGGPVADQNVQVTDNGTALSFSTAVSVTSGGSWLSVHPTSGTTPATLAVSASVTGLSPGTYQGLVTFTASAASNSPQALSVTLVVGSAPPPTTPPPTSPPPLTFTFSAVDAQSSGNQRLHISGRGSIDSNGKLTGNGDFTIYTYSGEDTQSTISMGTWTAAAVTSFTPTSTSGGGGRTGGDDILQRQEEGRSSSGGGTLVITIHLSPTGGNPLTGQMTIADTGTTRGITLAIDGGANFVPSRHAHVSIRTTRPTVGGGRGGGDGGDDILRR